MRNTWRPVRHADWRRRQGGARGCCLPPVHDIIDKASPRVTGIANGDTDELIEACRILDIKHDTRPRQTTETDVSNDKYR